MSTVLKTRLGWHVNILMQWIHPAINSHAVSNEAVNNFHHLRDQKSYSPAHLTAPAAVAHQTISHIMAHSVTLTQLTSHCSVSYCAQVLQR